MCFRGNGPRGNKIRGIDPRGNGNTGNPTIPFKNPSFFKNIQKEMDAFSSNVRHFERF
jgi:hypothetical protein